jgi:hypothetical protein
MSTHNYMAIDQHGETYHNLGSSPREELLERLGESSAKKMYRDGKDGKVYHVGWIVGSLWLTVYRVEPMRKPVRF